MNATARNRTAEAEQSRQRPIFGLRENKDRRAEKQQRDEQRDDGDRAPNAALDQRFDAHAPAQNDTFEHG